MTHGSGPSPRQAYPACARAAHTCRPTDNAAVEIEIAPGVAVVDAPNGARLRGPAEAISATLQGPRVLRDADEGTTAQLGPCTLLVSGYLPDELPPRTISLPGHAWNI